MDPKELLQNPEKIKDLIAVLQALLPNSENQVQEEPTTKPKTKTKRKSTKNKDTEKSESKNKFLEMQEMYMFKDDTSVDKKLAKNPPIPRTRSFSMITVKCRVCGRSEEVNPNLVYDASRYKCNNCSSTQG